MSERLIKSAADWVPIWRAAISERGWTHREVDFRAEWGDGYCSKLLCGDREPTATTISRMNSALGLYVRVDIVALTP